MRRRNIDWGAVADDVAHRPWPVPDRAWRMTMTWSDLLFAHWPVEAGSLSAMLPDGLVLDTFDGVAWLGVVPFRMDDTGLRGLPSPPALATFPELNVRTYVRAASGPPRPGVWFFSLDAASRVAVEGARTLFHLPYFKADMRCAADDDWVVYSSRRTDGRLGPGDFEARYRPVGPPRFAAAGSLEAWLTERYCLYAAHRGGLTRADVNHARWPLRDAEVDITVNTVCDAHGIDLGDSTAPPLLHAVPSLHVVGWLPEPVG